ncbi:MAG: hypothetical protein M3Z05_20195 [Gemmatimonadota bacterium]|nr:hypothetical protein [Gemmatimonadota bacterium]
MTMLIGALKCAASPSAEELAAFDPLGALARVVKIEGTRHFPHEEAPDVVVNYLTHGPPVAP